MYEITLRADKDRCKTCNGRKVVRDRKLLEVHIDKGMKDGQKITFRGESNQVMSLIYIMARKFALVNVIVIFAHRSLITKLATSSLC